MRFDELSEGDVFTLGGETRYVKMRKIPDTLGEFWFNAVRLEGGQPCHLRHNRVVSKVEEWEWDPWMFAHLEQGSIFHHEGRDFLKFKHISVCGRRTFNAIDLERGVSTTFLYSEKVEPYE